MPKIIKCPHCKVELDYLIEDRVQRAYYRVERNGDCDLNDYGDVINSRYYCPDCDKQITDKKILKQFNIEE